MRSVSRRTALRAVLLVTVLAATGALLSSWAHAPSNAIAEAANQSDASLSEREQVVPTRDNVTVVTTDPPGGNDGRAAIAAFAPDGRVLYHNNTYGNYFDVDPDPPGSRTVLYVAGSRYEDCPDRLQAQTDDDFEGGCAEIAVERTNLTTGETERVHTAVTGWDIWHDVDRVGEDRLLVADIAEDRVFVLNTTTDAVEWEWRAEEDLFSGSGGQPGDWTHVNDVEQLHDGRVMVSLRNMDRVVFLSPDGELQRDWTLGSEDNYDILYEQHNPDYIPADRGGPAIVVGDSENNRAVEYQRVDGEWRRSWSWQDDDLRWPRDADRLPGGHTLVTDSQGDRLLELDEHDRIVWEIAVETPYEAERLGTGDESATGRSKASLGNGSLADTAADRSGRTTGIDWVVAFVTGPVVNGVLYVAPGWVTVHDLPAVAVFALAVPAWFLLELRWSSLSPGSVRRLF